MVGESGCGKSTLGRLLIRLLPPTAGSVIFHGADITQLHPGEMREKRPAMQIIFQDPYGALNPRMSVEDIIAEPLLIHGARHGAGTRQSVAAMLDVVGLPAHPRPLPARVLRRASASASGSPARLYLGNIVEIADKRTLYAKPLNPYTQALIAAVPVAYPAGRNGGERRGNGWPAIIPSALNPPSGCQFHTRCRHAMAVCRDQQPTGPHGRASPRGVQAPENARPHSVNFFVVQCSHFGIYHPLDQVYVSWDQHLLMGVALPVPLLRPG